MENSFTFEEEEEKEEAKVIESLRLVLSPPFSLLVEDGSEGRQRTPNLLRRVLSLFSHLHIGFDLNSFELPPLFNMPKSQLQCYGESLYCIEEDYLSRCAKGKNSLERFVSVVAWSISTTRPATFAQAPFNPILGETHHVSSASLNVLLEQVSHHPPVSALHATDAEENIELIWCHNPVPKYHGGSQKLELKHYSLCQIDASENSICYVMGGRIDYCQNCKSSSAGLQWAAIPAMCGAAMPGSRNHYKPFTSKSK